MSRTKKVVISISAILLALIIALITVIIIRNNEGKKAVSSVIMEYSSSEVDATISGEYMFKDSKEYLSMGDSVDILNSEDVENEQMVVDGVKFSKKSNLFVCKFKIKNNSETENILLNVKIGDYSSSHYYKTSMAYLNEEIENSNLYKIIGGDVEDAVLGSSKSAYIYVKIEANSFSEAFTGKIQVSLTKTDKTPTEQQGILKVGEIVKRGTYPQSFVGSELNEKLINEKNKGSLSETGKVYHTEVSGEILECKEYLFEKEKYVLVEKASFYGDGGTFSSGETFGTFYESSGGTHSGKYTNGQKLFFKVEPIKFKIMEFTETTMTLDCTLALGSMIFGKSYWKGSSIEKFLNTTFLTESGLDAYASEQAVKNSLPDKYVDGEAADSKNYIWIASVDDLKRWYPEQNIQIDLQDPPTTRAESYEGAYKRGSDFSYATHTPKGREENGLCSYHLRTAGAKSIVFHNCAVSEIGSIGAWGDLWYSDGLGYCPVFMQKL